MDLKDYTCGLCGEEFSSNCAPGDIECDCGARLCPCCGAWFTATEFSSPQPLLAARGHAILGTVAVPQGGTLVIAINRQVNPEEARELSEIAAEETGVPCAVVTDAAAVKAWHPDNAPREVRESMAETRLHREKMARIAAVLRDAPTAYVARRDALTVLRELGV